MLREVRLYCHLLYTQTNQPHPRFTWNNMGIYIAYDSPLKSISKLRLKIQIMLLYAGRATGLLIYVCVIYFLV